MRALKIPDDIAAALEEEAQQSGRPSEDLAVELLREHLDERHRLRDLGLERIRQIDAGEVETIPWSEARRRIQARLDARRR